MSKPESPTASRARPARIGEWTVASDPAPRAPGVRILCVDDHAVLVEGLRAQFSIDGHLQIVGRLASAENLIGEIARLNPDIALLDIEMPGPDIFETADRLRHQHPGLRFVFLSAHIRDGYLTSAFKCGAWGYFSKGDELEDIVAGLLEVARSPGGTFVMTPKVRERCGSAAPARSAPRSASGNGRPTAPSQALTPRETEILRLIGKGLSRTEIAKEISRSAKTVDGHQERILKKLNLSSRAELMKFSIREGFAEA